MQQTSLDAYSTVTKPQLNRNQKMVLESLEAIAPACNKQIAANMNWPINSVTPRVLELRKKGAVTQAYIAKDPSGRNAIYWKPKEQ